MKLRFGEFPEHHHFLLVVRPFVEWNFKFLGWLVFASTVQFAYEKTGNRALLFLVWFSYLLLLAFIGTFVDWVLSFQRNRIPVVSGEDLVAAARIGPGLAGSKGIKRRNQLRAFFRRIRRVFIVIISLLLSIVLIGAANLATDQILDALIEFHKKAK